jgi:molybdenum cofactor synthesis domain-containing protein
MIPLSEAQRLVWNSCEVLDPVEVDLAQAMGLVLAADVVAAEMVPPFANSAVDGFGVRSGDVGDVPVDLEVVGTIAAGSPPDISIGPGQAVRIMTGAPIPPGVDAVVMVEETEMLDADRVRINNGVGPGTAVRAAGEDVMPGDLLFEAGTEIRPAVHGVLASVNARRVMVWPRVRVAILSTGDELVTDGSELAPGQIRESNISMLVGLAAQTGCVVTDLGVIADDEAVLEQVLREAAVSHDAIITSGGVSMGDYDVVKAVLGRIAEMHWMQIAIKPAKPFAFGLLGGIPVFGLPGNPVSSLVSYEMIARPALRQMMGYRHPERPRVTGLLDGPYRRRSDGKEHLIRATSRFGEDGRIHVEPVAVQGSHQLAATALADAIVVIPDGNGLDVGAEVEVVLLSV